MMSRVKELQRMCDDINENGGLDSEGWQAALLAQIAQNLAVIADVMLTDRKTENCSEKPNNCEPQTLDDIGRQIQDAYDKGLLPDAGAVQAWYEAVKDESQTEPLPKTLNGVKIADAVAWADKWLKDNPVSEMWDMIRTLRDATEWQDEPQTERSEE